MHYFTRPCLNLVQIKLPYPCTRRIVATATETTTFAVAHTELCYCILPNGTEPINSILVSRLRIGSQMQEVWGSNPRLGGLRVDPFQVSGGMSTLQSRASGLQSTTQGIPSGSKILLRVSAQTLLSFTRFTEQTCGCSRSGDRLPVA